MQPRPRAKAAAAIAALLLTAGGAPASAAPPSPTPGSASPAGNGAQTAPSGGQPASSAGAGEATRGATAADVLARARSTDWRALDPDATVYLELPAGRVVIELARSFAPHAIDNLVALIHAHWFDGLYVVRVQDNYVVQWGDVEAHRPPGAARRSLAAEFERPSRGLAFTPLPDADTYAPQTGFIDGFPAAVDPRLGRAWLVHCYGMVGAGRDEDVDSGNGAELYAVIGQAARHLDRNATLLGRIVQGMELLSSLPRGSGELGFYERPEQRVKIRSMRLAADVPAAQRTALEVLRTDTPTFAAWVEARRNRRESWFKVPAGHVDVCNVPLPSRPAGTATH